MFGAVLAGASRLPWSRFLVFNALGAVVWAMTFGAVGYALGYSWETLEQWIGRSGLVLLVAGWRHWSAGGAAGTLAAVMITLSSGLSYFDLNFMDLPRIIAAGVVHGAGGVALIDPGPSSTLPRLRATLATAGLSLDDVTAILLTHIHLDHAGATGTLVREHPRLRVLRAREGRAAHGESRRS